MFSNLVTECENSWSPGLAVFIAPGIMNGSLLMELAGILAPLSRKLGRARRITVGEMMSKEVVGLLYKSFYCVEYVNSVGVTNIIETATSASP